MNKNMKGIQTNTFEGSTSLFIVFPSGFKQLGTQITYEWNNEGIYGPLRVQIQAIVSRMEVCVEVQCGGTSTPVLALMDAFNWCLNVLSKLL